MTSTVTWPPLTKYVQVVRKPYSRVGSDKKCTYDYGEGGEYFKAKKTRTHRRVEDGFYLNHPGFHLIGIGSGFTLSS